MHLFSGFSIDLYFQEPYKDSEQFLDEIHIINIILSIFTHRINKSIAIEFSGQIPLNDIFF